MPHICFRLFWWWALSAAFRCASLRCFEAQGQCSRRVVVACGHLTQWAVGTVGWLTAVRGLGGVIDVGTFASVTAPTRCRETPSPRRPLVTAIGRRAARLAYLSAHPPIRVNLIPSLVARVRRASGCLLFRFRESTSHHRACVLVSDRRLH